MKQYFRIARNRNKIRTQNFHKAPQLSLCGVALVFPVGGELPYAEQNGYQQSSVTIQTAIDLVYSDGYHADKLKKIAVNRNNVLQCEYTRIHYPDSEILEYDGIDECIRAIKRGEAGCTLVETLRALRLLGEDKSLEMLPLTDTCGFCSGVSYGDTGLPRVLNHGLSILGDDYGISHAYQYVDDITSYNMRDFMRTHMWVVYLLAAVLAVWLLCIFIVRYRMLKRISEAEAKHNHALQQALMKAQQANYARQLFLNNVCPEQPEKAAETAAPVTLTGRKILIVEDEVVPHEA